MNPDPNPNPNPNRNNPNSTVNLMGTVNLIRYNVRIGCMSTTRLKRGGQYSKALRMRATRPLMPYPRPDFDGALLT